MVKSMLAWLIHALRGSDKMILLLLPHAYTSPVVKQINFSSVCDGMGAWDLGKHLLRKNGSSSILNPLSIQPWGAGKLLTSLVTPQPDIRLSQLCYPVLMPCTSHSA